MKIKILSLLLLGAALALFACKKDEAEKAPVACFTIAHASVNAGETAHFTTCSENAHHHEWDFGDGGTSTNDDTEHIYNTAGTYTVTQHVFNADKSKSDMTSKTITVN